ncbi:unnamed protein product [Sphacelaria rigidula]
MRAICEEDREHGTGDEGDRERDGDTRIASDIAELLAATPTAERLAVFARSGAARVYDGGSTVRGGTEDRCRLILAEDDCGGGDGDTSGHADEDGKTMMCDRQDGREPLSFTEHATVSSAMHGPEEYSDDGERGSLRIGESCGVIEGSSAVLSSPTRAAGAPSATGLGRTASVTSSVSVRDMGILGA